jgi:hypothetical protein
MFSVPDFQDVDKGDVNKHIGIKSLLILEDEHIDPFPYICDCILF